MRRDERALGSAPSGVLRIRRGEPLLRQLPNGYRDILE